MLMKAAQWLVDSLLSDFSNADQRITCIYGCELWLYTILSTLGLLILGVFLQSFGEAVIIIFIFYTCQSTGGGFHASSHMRCFLTMAIGLLTGLLLMKAPVFQCALPYLCLLSLVMLLLFPLCLHPHKQYLKGNEKALRKQSYFATLCIAVCIVGLSLLENLNLFLQAVSPPALLLFQDFLQETKYNFLHIVACHMVAAIVRQAGQVASHIAKAACWAHPNPCKMRKCPFAAARSSCAYSLRKEAQHPRLNRTPSSVQ